MPYSMTVYTMSHCAPCNEFKNFLDKNNINYLVKEITGDKEASKEFNDKGFMYTPTSIIEIDGKTHTIVGGNREEVEQLLHIK
ncbi:MULTISPECIES: glutaredoxin family protein [Bacillus]|uniref:Glutaredoxin family protein n=2 Tax=Bacillus cereus group TaxID=86661 RepID=A0A2C1DQ37_BACCE|nr:MULTISPECIES: glutaredoxin family protein [Bacillus cereus group]OFD69948.1 hypothetical protein BWGOE8_58710 [Bacillus mycoides]OFD69959.1 hypothetical protein BWGOE9_57950 [Bacillus mycoides]OFD70585.1 hypothetical protein BWGOE10_57760 [Bacillus mycoides]PGT02593.1 glutaredoxin family protein [Bacillus cereus]